MILNQAAGLMSFPSLSGTPERSFAGRRVEPPAFQGGGLERGGASSGGQMFSWPPRGLAGQSQLCGAARAAAGNARVLKGCRVPEALLGQRPSPGQGPACRGIRDPHVGPLHPLGYSDDINHIPKRPAGLILPNLQLQTNSIIFEAK